MPCSYTIVPDKKLLWTRIWGYATYEEMRSLLRSLASDPRYGAGFRVLDDMRDLRDTDMGFAQMMSLKGLVERVISRNPERVPYAVLAPDEHAFGIARMYATLMSDSPWARVVPTRCLDEALAILGLDDLALSPLPSRSLAS